MKGTMKSKTIFIILCVVCAALPLAAQITAPENMVQIPAGKFWMGRAYTIYTDSADLIPRDKMDDRPANNVYLDAFFIDKYEVTNADYAKFVQATGTKPPWHWPQGKIPTGKEKVPVYNVNWFEATDFCKWAGKRLPTRREATIYAGRPIQASAVAEPQYNGYRRPSTDAAASRSDIHHVR
jgi:formylglycine-generating enzyme required for sulfatase activity